MPSHKHEDLNWTTDSYHTSLDPGNTVGGVKINYEGAMIRYKQGDFRTGYTGGGQAHENMSPYQTLYMWKRVS